MFNKIVIGAIYLFLSQIAHAGVISLPTQEISSIRGEGNVVLLAFATPFAADSGCNRRVWIGLTDEASKARFSIAMLAFASGKSVSVRANDDEASKVYGDCKMHDIVVSK